MPRSAIVLLALSLGACATAAAGRRPAPEPATEIALQRYQDVLWALPAREAIYAGEPRTFLFDTAAGLTTVTPAVFSPELCRGRVVALRMSGERVDLATCEQVRLELANGFPLTDLDTVGVFDLQRLLPPDWPAPGGVIGLDAFARRAVTLDLGAGRFFIESEDSLARRTRELTPLTMRLARQAGGATLDVFVAATTGAGRIWLEVDSGNTGPVLLAPHAARMAGVDLDAPGVRHEPARDGRPERWHVPSARLCFASTLCDAHPVVVQDLVIDGNIGASVLEKWIVTLDLANARAWARKR